ncbi:hypothetical protein BCR36DRAFT_368778 [Piromyces finnis]|uniref:CCHC-type domain-containing protein n=1 Tax=Piromyces finnis TaxID=1754191 RepID=A0A1Y1VDQ5_9FUNG|nr:hypothetical protein BCR36DRAFT_368778 [Piromyces finnis]|eukprot:ORX53746.1 hypothetical protein BCR36DRAFT_368778 [Piromyces finnis]
MVDASKVKRDLPYLCDYGKDIDSWMEDFISVMEIHDIQEPERIFVWLKVAVEADIKNVLKSLCTTRNNIKRYPNYREVQSAIEEYLEIKPGDKCSVLKMLKIKGNETIKNKDFQKIISVDDYLCSIRKRVYLHSQVILAECETLSEAFKVAEKAEKAEKAERRTIENNEAGNISMVFQNESSNRNILLDHPLYKGLVNNDYNNNNYSGLYSNARHGVPPSHSNFGTQRNYENVYFNNSNLRSIKCYYCRQMGHKASKCPNKRERNNRNNFNHSNQFNSQRNSYNRYENSYNSYDNNNYNNSYLNGFNTNNNNSSQDVSRGFNKNNYMDYYDKNNYDNRNNNYYMYTSNNYNENNGNNYKKDNFNPVSIILTIILDTIATVSTVIIIHLLMSVMSMKVI